jgi:formylglycine-generating enzyme required for sulfatase activity
VPKDRFSASNGFRVVAVEKSRRNSIWGETENWLGMKFARIPSGEFMIGTYESVSDLERDGLKLPRGFSINDEGPVLRVKISEFSIGQHEVTVSQFRAFIEASGYRTDAEKDGIGGWGVDRRKKNIEQSPKYDWRNTGFSQTDAHPVINVSWNDANAFCQWLTDEYRKRGETVTCRLPTEAQWEYAARANVAKRYSTGNSARSLDGFANVRDSSFEIEFSDFDYQNRPSFPFNDGAIFSRPVGSYCANGFRLYDMHGNVSEWCLDWYSNSYVFSTERTETNEIVDPKGAGSGTSRVFRGGSWFDGPINLRSSFRDNRSPEDRNTSIGFRVVLQ